MYRMPFLHPFMYQWAFGLFPCPVYSEWCCDAHRGVSISLKFWFQFFWIYTQKWDCWLYCISIINFLRNLHTLSPNSHTILHSNQQYRRVPFSLYSCQYLSSFFFLIIAILISMMWYWTVVLLCISMMIIGIDHQYVFFV